ncbi:hypothetical protein LTR86_002773 [Recurvomyces mirabilis]|nr:hypothetical protein LTR86_002773 [Recurvomyces mirabilis]
MAVSWWVMLQRTHIAANSMPYWVSPMKLLIASHPSDNVKNDVPSDEGPPRSNDTGGVVLKSTSAFATAAEREDALPLTPEALSAVNVEHMGLLLHLLKDHGMNILGGSVAEPSKGMVFAVQTGLRHVYLLYQLLAFSARHSAYLQPERSSRYEHLAIQLQTHAVSLFNAEKAEVDAENCVAILLFASILGHHVLTDTLAKRELDNIQTVTESLVQCMEVHRGIYTVATSAWPLLLSTEIGPTIAWSARFTSQMPRGDHCDPLLEMIARSEGMTEVERSALLLAIKYLQIGFDAGFQDDEVDQGKKHQMVYSWPMLAVPEYSSLLKHQRGEALVVLAWYTVLLHLAREMWQVGDAGRRILRVITESIGLQWRSKLQYAIEQVS